MRCPAALALVLFGLYCDLGAAQAGDAATSGGVDIRWSALIPLRDGVGLNATVYRPKEQRAPAPCIFTLTPYIGDSYHDRAVYFAGQDLPFLLVDVRGRGNSAGSFTPFAQEINDGYDVVNYNSGKPVSDETMADARPVSVTLVHDQTHPSTLYVQLGQPRRSTP
jgi:hypothetical protein